MPKVSVIVPIYKVEKYIERCVRSVIGQTFTDYELLLVDDCGGDGSLGIAEKILQNTANITYQIIKRKENGGLSAARNSGIQAAKGDYYYFLDSDDWMEPDCLRKLADAAEREHVDIVVCNAYVAAENGARKKFFANDEIAGKYYFPDSLLLLLQGKYPLGIWLNLYKKELFEKIRFPEGCVHEDNLIQPYLYAAAHSIFVMKDCLYNYFMRSGSIMHSFQPQTKDVPENLERMRQDILRGHPEMADALLQYCTKTIRDIAGLIANNADSRVHAMPILNHWQQFIRWRDIKALNRSGRKNMAVFMVLFKLSPSLLYYLFQKHYLGNQK